MNNLPKYWAVEYNGSTRYRITVLKYLNDTYGSNWGGGYKYYGYDGTGTENGSKAHDYLERFSNPVTLLTIDEFEACLAGKAFSMPTIIHVPKI